MAIAHRLGYLKCDRDVGIDQDVQFTFPDDAEPPEEEAAICHDSSSSAGNPLAEFETKRPRRMAKEYPTRPFSRPGRA